MNKTRLLAAMRGKDARATPARSAIAVGVLTQCWNCGRVEERPRAEWCRCNGDVERLMTRYADGSVVNH